MLEDNSYIGKKFGRLLVVEEVGRTKWGYIKYKCECECGTFKEIESQSLRSGRTQSCGCLQREKVKQAVDLNNESDLREGTKLSSLDRKNLNKNNTSGHVGVTKNKRNGKWIAQISLKRKNKYLGEFEFLKDAIAARKEAEDKYYQPILKKYSE